MVSVASGGTTDRIVARILFRVQRAGSGTPARYSSTFFGAPLPFAAELRLPDFTFFMRAMLQEPPLQVHAPDHRAAVRHEKCHSLKSIRTNPPAPRARAKDPTPPKTRDGPPAWCLSAAQWACAGSSPTPQTGLVTAILSKLETIALV